MVHITDVMNTVSASISVYEASDDWTAPEEHVFSCATTAHASDMDDPRDWARDALVMLIERI